MGIGDALNGLVDGGEHLIDKGKEKLGDAVEWGAHKGGALLEAAGADGLADKVEDFGDGIADHLGADVGEQQLGDTEQAGELIHGDPSELRASAKHLKDFHKAFDQVGRGMKKLDSSHWRGEGAEAFRKKFTMHPTKWAHAADACKDAAGALESFADTVEWAKRQAQDAIDLYRKGVKASEQAVADYNKKADAYNAKVTAGDDPGPRPQQDMNAGLADIEAAREKLAEARRQRNEAGRTAERTVKTALAHAPAEPPALARLNANYEDFKDAAGMELLHVGGGVLKGAGGLAVQARKFNPIDPYNLTHPAQWFENANMALAQAATVAADPEPVLKDMWKSVKEDPSEFGGRLIPEAAGSKGAGMLRGGMRAGMRAGEKGLAREGEGLARKAQQSDPADRTPEERTRTNETDPVDLVSGKMYLPQTDVTLPGTLPLVFSRRLESGSRLGRWFGPSWLSTVDQRLEIDAEGVIFVTEDGLLLTYPHPAPGVPTLPTHGPRCWPLDRVDEGYTVTDPQTGRTWHFADRTPDLAVLEQIDDRNGNWITFEHDTQGTPLAVTSSGGYRLTLTVEDERVTALSLAGAAPDGTDQLIKRYAYTESGDLTQVFDSSGRPLTFTYDERGRVTSWTDSNNSSYTYEYDDQDRCIAEGGEAGHMALRFSYDEVDPETGHRITTTYSTEGHTRRYYIDENRHVVAETDQLGHTFHFTRDRLGQILTETDPLGRTTSYRYDEVGNVVSATRADGREVTGEYGAFNRLTSTTPTGHTTQFTHDEAGRLASVTDPLGHITTVRCDRAGLPVEITDPLGAVTRYERDAFGRPVTMTDPTGLTTRLEWTTEGKLASRTSPDGTVESWTYDGEGNCTTHTDPLGGVTRFEYTHFDLLTARTTPDGVRHEFAHDAELRLTRVTNPQGLTWDYAYDPAGRLISETDFDNRALTYAYDAADQLISRTNALDETTTFDRDALGRPTRKDAAGQVTTFAYDLTGQLAEAVSPDGTRLTILRDQYGRVRTETVDDRTLTYDHDELGRRTGRTTPSGARTTWSYDAVGRRTDLVVSGRRVDVSYDAAGRELTRGISGFLTLANTYDPMGRLATQTATSDGETLQRRAYTYRADGNLTALDDHLDGPRTFTLDPAGRVTAVHATNWTESYAYDAAGNQTTADWPTTHPGHEATGDRTYTGTRITRAGTVRYEHDALGRVTLRQKPRLSRKPDTWRYAWDPEDRLTQVTTPDSTVWRYTYDALGRRTSKQRMSPDGTTVTERVTFTWDGTTLCEQTTAAPNLPDPVTLTWDHRGLHPIAQTERITAADAPQTEIDSRFFAIVTDLVGTPRELIDEQGNIAWHTRTTLWGTTTWNASATSYTPLRFPGQYFDPETALHYNYFRHYDPETARYISLDRLGLSAASNTLAYVSNPHSWTDPLGLAPYKNQMPEVLDQELAAAESLGVKPLRVGDPGFEDALNSGTIKWAIDEQGDLLIMPKHVDGIELKHPVLTRGGDVHAAGEAEVAGAEGSYFGIEINNNSGHYLPSRESTQIGREAFERAGIQFF
ncbi:putative T7SS-secreted protein [Streptomyces xanthii]|uniref:RHS repeat protein n=1 Tax=Streptomyces xanthii TaxID=2768069 RepID=A0A7H1B8L0_9ACTN|nr:DUF6531 domain-containing protein [Streptomyces xanthii]QNS05065.1 RHS repeat protein [Streptomyces xanthii]